MTNTPTSASAYDLVEYPSKPIRDCHPVRMASIAALAGLTPPAIASSTIVDLGCGMAGNLMSIAAAYPGATAIGVDPSREAISRGQEMLDAAGLPNMTLVQDVRTPIDDGQADYVIAHGVLSWVDADTRAASSRRPRGSPALADSSTSPTTPSRARCCGTSRGGSASGSPASRSPREMRSARRPRCSSASASRRPYEASGTAYARVAARQQKLIAERDPHGLFHDELNENWSVLSVTGVARQVGELGLGYVGELLPADRWRAWIAPEVAEQIAAAAGPSAAARQQQVDDLQGAPFHGSLFVKGAAPEPAAADRRAAASPPRGRWHLRWSGGAAPRPATRTRRACSRP